MLHCSREGSSSPFWWGQCSIWYCHPMISLRISWAERDVARNLIPMFWSLPLCLWLVAPTFGHSFAVCGVRSYLCVSTVREPVLNLCFLSARYPLLSRCEGSFKSTMSSLLSTLSSEAWSDRHRLLCSTGLSCWLIRLCDASFPQSNHHWSLPLFLILLYR